MLSMMPWFGLLFVCEFVLKSVFEYGLLMVINVCSKFWLTDLLHNECSKSVFRRKTKEV